MTPRHLRTAAAAAALDATHAIGERGPRTFMARRRVAAALDAGKKPLAPDVHWLEHVARIAIPTKEVAQ